MIDDNNDIVFKYFNGELSADEQSQFREALLHDEVLRKKYNDYSMLLSLVEQAGHKELKSKLSLAGEKYDRRRHTIVSVSVTGMILLVLLLLYFFIFRSGNNPVKQDKPDAQTTDSSNLYKTMTDSKFVDTPSTVKSAPNKVSDERKQKEHIVPKIKAASKDELFAMYFTPYRNGSLNPGIRGKANAHTVEEFMQLYWDKDYYTATNVFEQLPEEIQKNVNLQFQYANCLLISGRFESAAEIFSSVANDHNGRYAEESNYFLALVLLKLNKINDSKIILESIIRDKNHPFYAQSSELLKKLSDK